jgi:hypothetical protein
MVFFQVFLLSTLQCTVTLTVEKCTRLCELNKYQGGCVSLKKYKSQGKAVEVTVNSKEENTYAFVWISSKNSVSGQITGQGQHYSPSPASLYTMYTLVLYFIILQILCLLNCPSSTILFEESPSLTLGIKQM